MTQHVFYSKYFDLSRQRQSERDKVSTASAASFLTA
jgi:hypothetical protein